ncbi:TniQ family protein [Streptomyces sp. NPDC088254]|uniref:TniQ family protein n=1 Tax=Streptomyces sp. NPDC088254 TaxID=3365847 RepID=UPI0037F17D93
MSRLPEPLPRALAPLPGEGLPGLTLRLSHRLDLSPTMLFARTGLQTSKGSYTSGRLLLALGDRLTAFAQATQLTPVEAARLTLAPDSERYPPISMSLHPRPNRFFPYDLWVFTAFTRYCPRCLLGDGSVIQQRHGGPWKIRWRLPVIFICQDHQTFLRDGCPRCQRSAHAFDQAGSRLLPLSPHGGLHPAQCRNRETGLTPTRQFCGARLDSMAAQPPQPEITPSLWRLQNRITDLLNEATDPLEASRYFTGLRVMSAILQATWPQGRHFTPTGLSDALDEHVDQLKRRAGERKDHAERLRWDAPPRSAVATAILLDGAATLLALERPALREALRTMLPSAPAKSSKQWGRTWLHLKKHASTQLRDDVEAAVANYL